jgi:hypothetical protein
MKVGQEIFYLKLFSYIHQLHNKIETNFKNILPSSVLAELALFSLHYHPATQPASYPD